MSGFYIDVGAHHPDNKSVTKFFHKLGWHGMNIEPQKFYFDLLVAARPNDLNYQLVVSDRVGEMSLYLPEINACASLEKNSSVALGPLRKLKSGLLP